MKRPFQIGDIVTLWWHRGSASEAKEPGLRVEGFEDGTGRIIARAYYKDGSLKREAIGPPEVLTLDSPAPGSEGSEEFEHARDISEIRDAVLEIKELLITLVGMLRK